MVQKVTVRSELEARLHHATTGKLSLSAQQSGTFFEGKDTAAKGEEWASLCISCAQDTVGLLHPLPLQLLSYGKPLPSQRLSNRPLAKILLSVYGIR